MIYVNCSLGNGLETYFFFDRGILLVSVFRRFTFHFSVIICGTSSITTWSGSTGGGGVTTCRNSLLGTMVHFSDVILMIVVMTLTQREENARPVVLGGGITLMVMMSLVRMMISYR